MSPRRWRLLVMAVLPQLLLAACETAPAKPAPVLAALSPPPAKVVRAKPKRPEPCKAAHLSAARKEALFRQFAAHQTEGAESAELPPPAPNCTLAAR